MASAVRCNREAIPHTLFDARRPSVVVRTHASGAASARPVRRPEYRHATVIPFLPRRRGSRRAERAQPGRGLDARRVAGAGSRSCRGCSQRGGPHAGHTPCRALGGAIRGPHACGGDDGIAGSRCHLCLCRQCREQRGHRAPARSAERRPDGVEKMPIPGITKSGELDADGGEPRPPHPLRRHARRAPDRGGIRHRSRDRQAQTSRQRPAPRQHGVHRHRSNGPLPARRLVSRPQGDREPDRPAGDRAGGAPGPAQPSERACDPRRRGEPERDRADPRQ